MRNIFLKKNISKLGNRWSISVYFGKILPNVGNLSLKQTSKQTLLQISYTRNREHTLWSVSTSDLFGLPIHRPCSAFVFHGDTGRLENTHTHTHTHTK